MIIAGVTSFSPSRLTPPNGFAKVSEPIATLYSPAPKEGSEGPVRLPSWRSRIDFPAASAKLELGHSGQPELFQAREGGQPPGLKLPARRPR